MRLNRTRQMVLISLLLTNAALTSQCFGQVVVPGVKIRAAGTIAPAVQGTAVQAGIPMPGNPSATTLPNTQVPVPGATVAAAPVYVPLTRLDAIRSLEISTSPAQILGQWSGVGDDSETVRPPSPLGREVARIRYAISRHDWDDLAAYVAELKQEEQMPVYELLVEKLTANPTSNQVPVNPAGQAYREKAPFGLDDMLGILMAAPAEHSEKSLSMLARLCATAVSNGNQVGSFVDELQRLLESDRNRIDTADNTGSVNDETNETAAQKMTSRQAARLLSLAGQKVTLDRFLPNPNEAIESDDAEALNLLSECYVARFGRSQDKQDLELAWKLTQAILASSQAEQEAQKEALTRAVSLSPQVRNELGEAWLQESFSTELIRGKRIVGTVGPLCLQALMIQPTNPAYRLERLRLLSDAIDAYCKAGVEIDDDWQNSLNLLIRPWLAEAELSYRLDTSASLGPRMQYDSFGNVYFTNSQQMMAMQQQRRNQPRPISVADLVKHRPNELWIDSLDASLKPSVFEWLAKLYLKVGEEESAFPYIERLAIEYPELAKSLVNEFLRVWAQNNDPNTARRFTSPIYSIYGFNSRAEGIPLTRSKQERNLAELTQWVQRLQALEGIEGEIDESLLVRAFTVSHSRAEIFRLETIESVFGELDKLAPKTIAGLLQQTRRNLGELWRDPNVQKQNQTNRRKKDIESEVLQGYQDAGELVQLALAAHPGDWSLLLVQAAMTHDEINYKNELSTSSRYTEDRFAALEGFKRAAQAYIEKTKEMDVEDETTSVFELWFYASLGACDVGQLDAEKTPILGETNRIREMLMQMPAAQADRHLAKFSNSLFTMLRSVNPSVKHRYLRQGFAIVGDHEQALEAKKVFDYYEDLVTEIELQVEVDGASDVGSAQPFGMFVSIRHTREIERESGGFGRYLQNQNNAAYAYNYGRPTENYREKFEEGVRDALNEHFDVLSVTFQEEGVTSKADRKYGWRTTPYAYILLKSRGEEIDRVPPLKLDLDFLDSSGYVVLPIESPMIPINSVQSEYKEPASEVVRLVQTLDERQAGDGKLILEVKAITRGLTPSLESLVDLEPAEFSIEAMEDDGVSVTRFDPDSDQTVMLCERIWTITLEGRKDLTSLPKEFQFGSPSVDAEEVVFQRYADADLEVVEETVSLAASYGQTDRTWLFFGVGAVLLVLILVGLSFVFLRNREPELEQNAVRLPPQASPFSAIHVLRDLHRNNGFSSDQASELEADIQRIEAAFFSPEAKANLDPREVAERWIKQSAKHS